MVRCINSIIPVLLLMFVINSNRRCRDLTELYVNKIQEAPLHTLTPRPTDTTRNKFEEAKSLVCPFVGYNEGFSGPCIPYHYTQDLLNNSPIKCSSRSNHFRLANMVLGLAPEQNLSPA